MSSLAVKFATGIARLTHLGKRSDDQLTDVKAVTRWFESLPIGDAFKCQQAILEELKRFNENPSGSTKDRLGVLMCLDEKSRDLQDTLVRQYLRNPRMSRPMESQLWHAVYSLYWEIARGYHGFVLNFATGSGKIAQEDRIPLATLRAIRIFGQLLKWRAVRYLPAGEKLWLRLHNLYRIAEGEGFHRRTLAAYDGETGSCSCESTYLHVLMLHLANSGTLYPRQLDLLDRWLCNWHTLLRLDARADPALHVFSVDLSADSGARRIRKPDAEKPMRYWATAGLLEKLDDMQRALRDGLAPAHLGLTEDARTGESLELLGHLAHHWASLSAREQRRAKREAVKRLIDVAHGFDTLVLQLKSAASPVAASPYGLGLDYRETDDVQVYGFVTTRTRERASQMKKPVASPGVERWVAQDESECGYGATVESHDKDWLRVGALIGVKPHDAPVWKLGVVRRLTRMNDDSSAIGIETLAEPPELVMLYDTAASAGYTVDGQGNGDTGLPRSGLWLSGQPASLVIDPVHYAPGRIFRVQGRPDPSFIALGSPIERSEGWIRVAVEPVAS